MERHSCEGNTAQFYQRASEDGRVEQRLADTSVSGEAAKRVRGVPVCEIIAQHSSGRPVQSNIERAEEGNASPYRATRRGRLTQS